MNFSQSICALIFFTSITLCGQTKDSADFQRLLRRVVGDGARQLSPEQRPESVQRVLGSIRKKGVDVIYLKGGGRLEGTVEGERIRLNTAYGRFELPMADLALIDRRSQALATDRVITNGDERYSGYIVESLLQFVLADGAERISLRRESVRQIVFRSTSSTNGGTEAIHLISLRNGDSFRGAVKIDALSVLPRPVSLPVDLSRTASIICGANDRSRLRLLSNRSDMIDAYWAVDVIPVLTQYGGHMDLHRDHVASIDLLEASKIGLGHVGSVQSVAITNDRPGLSLDYDNRPGIRVQSLEKNSVYRGCFESNDRIVGLDQQPIRGSGFPDLRASRRLGARLNSLHRAIMQGEQAQAFVTVYRAGAQLVFRLYRAIEDDS